MKALVVIIAVIALSGCVTTQYKETSVDADGAATTTAYRGMSIVPPFGKLDPTTHTLALQIDKDGASQIAVGQDAKGIDATGQIQAAQMLGTLIIEAVKAYVAGLPAAAPGAPGGDAAAMLNLLGGLAK